MRFSSKYSFHCLTPFLPFNSAAFYFSLFPDLMTPKWPSQRYVGALPVLSCRHVNGEVVNGRLILRFNPSCLSVNYSCPIISKNQSKEVRCKRLARSSKTLNTTLFLQFLTQAGSESACGWNLLTISNQLSVYNHLGQTLMSVVVLSHNLQ